MSWFKELTSKAEALLVKLDQDAAQALQNSDGLLPTSMQTNEDFTSSFEQEPADNYLENGNIPTPVQGPVEVVPSVTTFSNQPAHSTVHEHLDVVKKVSERHQIQLAVKSTPKQPFQTPSSAPGVTESEISRNVIRSEEQTTTDTSPLVNDNPKDYPSVSLLETQETFSKTPSYSKKFTIQTSKTGLRPFAPLASKRRDNNIKINGFENLSERQTPIEDLGADVIRASINRSLQEYTHHSPLLATLKGERTDSACHSHFDNQPNLVRQTNDSKANETHLNRSGSSASFSIDVPDDRFADGRSASTDIAARLLKHSMSKRKKSTFYLHQVINRLANPSEPSTPIFSDQTRIKLRRAQMRVTSSIRRLNYYFQTYPMVKYLILTQLVIMQLLVIYVLFFYQSSGSASELSSQIKKQQQELSESQ